MATIVIEGADKSIDRVNKILAGIPSGAIKASYAALKRASATAKTKAGQFAAAEYTISKGDFMRYVTMKERVTGTAGGVASLKISYSGYVIPLLRFRTRCGKDGMVQTQVMRNGGATTLKHAFEARLSGQGVIAVLERVGAERLPIEQKFGPSAAHMLANEQVADQMAATIEETYETRIEHEMTRILAGLGG